MGELPVVELRFGLILCVGRFGMCISGARSVSYGVEMSLIGGRA